MKISFRHHQEGAFTPPGTLKGKIEFEKVWFAYTGDNYVLKDLNFTVNPGETIAIVGHTGSGKTTIISLLNRLISYSKRSDQDR